MRNILVETCCFHFLDTTSLCINMDFNSVYCSLPVLMKEHIHLCAFANASDHSDHMRSAIGISITIINVVFLNYLYSSFSN